jgi:ribosomal protein L4
MNKKERRLALATALQSAASDVVVVDSITQAAGAEGLTVQGTVGV